MNTIVVFSKIDCVVNGFPPTVELTPSETCMVKRLAHLPLHCRIPRLSPPRFWRSLIAKGLLKDNELTPLGKRVVDSVAESVADSSTHIGFATTGKTGVQEVVK